MTVYDGRPAADARALDRAARGPGVDLRLGPDVDPATAWADAALVTTSPSINPDYPTTEPRLRSALQALVAARAAGDPDAPALVSEPDLFLRLCPAPDDRRHGDEGQDDDVGAGRTRSCPRTRSTRRCWAGTSAIPLIERLPELTPDHRVVDRAVRAPAADAVARHDRRGLHERDLGPPRPARVGGGVPAGQAPARGARGPGRRARAQPRGPGRRRLRGPRHRARGAVPGRSPRGRAAWACSTAGSCPRRSSGCRSPAAAWRRPARSAGSCRSTSWASRARHNVSNALAAIAVGLLFGVAPDAIRRAAAGFTGRRAPAPESWACSTASGSSTTPRAPSPTR